MRPGGWQAIVSTGPRISGPRPGRVGDFGPDEPRGSDVCFLAVPLKDPSADSRCYRRVSALPGVLTLLNLQDVETCLAQQMRHLFH